MAQSSIAKMVIFSLLFMAPLCAQNSSCKEAEKETSSKQKVAQKNKTEDIEIAVKQWEDATTKLTKQLDSATGKMKGVIKEAKDADGYTIKVGDISITVDKGNPYYLKMFVFTVLLKEVLKQYDENPTIATKKIIEHGKRSFTSFAQAVGLMKVPVTPKKPWWYF